MTSDTIRVLIVDDHAVVRTGISTWIETKPELSLIGEASCGEEAVRLATELKPDVILMDVVMPGMDGIAATRTILEHNPKIRILVVTSFPEKSRAIDAVRAGAIGFILKDTSPQEMLEAIFSVAKNRPWLSTELTRQLYQPQNKEKPNEKNLENEGVTQREIEVLLLIAMGLSDQEIANRLVVSKATVRFHVNNILSKLHLENRTQAALYAIRNHLIDFH